MASITFKHVEKTYPGNVTVVPDLNLEIQDKEFVILVGPSGCGKSTTLRMIAGLEDISSGELYIGDRVVNDVAPKDRNIAMVFQNYALYPHMTVYKNIAFGLMQAKVPKDEIDRRVHEAAKALDLEPYLNRKPKALSGGQRQRVALGRAMVRNPDVFLLDEPLSNLDAKLRVEMRNAIRRIQQQIGITTVYVTHDQEEALAVSDRLAVMNNGVIQQINTPSRVYQRPANQFVSNFIGLSNFLTARVKWNGPEASLCFEAEGGYETAIPFLKREAAEGQEVMAAVRPEEFIMSTKGETGIPATVQNSVFLGTATHYFLTLPSGREVEAIQHSDELWEIIPNGTQVRLTVKEKKINVFTADGSTPLIIWEESR